MLFEWDDFGANHIISDMCQAHDCRDQLDKLHIMNPAFKATLFAIPGEMTLEMLGWCKANSSWIELGVHGFFHTSNYECEKMSTADFAYMMNLFNPIIANNFAKLFRAPGWQISDGALQWLADHDWIVADQSYNDNRRPLNLKSYVNDNGNFRVAGEAVEAYHGHVWDVGTKGNAPNGIYEDFENVKELVSKCEEFKFVTEYF